MINERRRLMSKSKVNWANEYLTFEALESGTFTYSKASSYSINKGAWTSLAANTATPTLNEGDTIRWKATISPTSSAGVGTFSSTCNYNAMGNPLSLNLGDTFVGVTTMPNKTYMFYHLFYNDTHIVNALNLALVCTTLRDSCYREMFKGCTALVVVPELPATSLASNCYRGMFSGCASLERTCRFPATSMGQYSCAYMFEYCTALTIVSDLIATTLDTYSYNSMFYGCTSLVIAPKIYATNLANFCCGGMFYGCTKLTEVDELPALTLATHCYEQMFYGCTSLVMGPELPATNLAANCYDNMFQGCINLRFAPELPATTLESYCYSSMFQNCTSLCAAPYLPAQTPVNYAYNPHCAAVKRDCTPRDAAGLDVIWRLHEKPLRRETQLGTVYGRLGRSADDDGYLVPIAVRRGVEPLVETRVGRQNRKLGFAWLKFFGREPFNFAETDVRRLANFRLGRRHLERHHDARHCRCQKRYRKILHFLHTFVTASPQTTMRKIATMNTTYPE